MTGRIKVNVDVVEQSTRAMKSSISKLEKRQEQVSIMRTQLQSAQQVQSYIPELSRMSGQLQDALNTLVDKVEASKTKIVTLDQTLAGK